MRAIGVVTTSRADFGIYRPVLRTVLQDRELALHLLVSGTHLSRTHGNTVDEIEGEGIPIADRLPIPMDSDAPEAAAATMGECTKLFAASYHRRRPDLLLILGDRFEMHAAAVAAVPFGIPMAHIHGGEVTEGAFDESFRHSMSKLSHLHFPATEDYARNLIRMGEEPWRVSVTGTPALDNMRTVGALDTETLCRELGIPSAPAPLLITYHPVTLEPDPTGNQIEALLSAVRNHSGPLVFTLPNADPGSRRIRGIIEAFASEHPMARVFQHLGSLKYYSLLRHAAAMVGNSSSGLVEAPSFELPVVNVGNRQRGRVRAANVIDVPATKDAIASGIRRAVSSEFRVTLQGMTNPYGAGDASQKIVSRIRSVPLDRRLLTKRFYMPYRSPSPAGHEVPTEP